MGLKEFIQFLVKQYFIIYTGSMIATFCFCMAFYPEESLPVSYPAWMLLFSLCGTLPGVVFYSKKELTKKQWKVRRLIHIVLLEIVLLTAGNILGMYEGIRGGFWFAITVLAVYAFVCFVTFWVDQKTAEELNEKLKERRTHSE